MVTIIKKGMSREEIPRTLKKHTVKVKVLDLKKYCGSISLSEEPMELQNKMRDKYG